MDDEKFINRDSIPVHQLNYCPAASVHKGPGLNQQQLNTAYFADAYFSPTLALFHWNGMELRQIIYAAETYIMAIMSIFSARVAQTNNHFHQPLIKEKPSGFIFYFFQYLQEL